MKPRRVVFAARPTLMRIECGHALCQAGFDVTMVDGGVQCLDAFHESLPEVLIIEPELPWGGGDGVLAIIHDEWAWHDIAVLVLSTEQRRSAMYNIARFNAGDFIAGSVSSSQLVERVLRLIGRRHKPLNFHSDV